MNDLEYESTEHELKLTHQTPQLQTNLAPGLTLVQADDFREWLMDLRVIDDNPIYKGEVYRLRFVFSNNYPIEVCIVYNLHAPRIAAPHTSHIPIHIHINTIISTY
jgi:ubiquitin-conjugating enzyme E2 W